MATSTGNGWKSWVIGALFTVSLGFGGVAWSGHETRIQALADEVAPVRERIATLEAQERFIAQQLLEMRVQLNRIEQRQIQGRSR